MGAVNDYVVLRSQGECHELGMACVSMLLNDAMKTGGVARPANKVLHSFVAQP